MAASVELPEVTASEHGGSMSTDFTGTNTEKIDEVIVALVELRTTVRLLMTVVGVSTPLILGLLSFLVAQSFRTEAKLERLTDRVERVERNLDQFSARLERLERGEKK